MVDSLLQLEEQTDRRYNKTHYYPVKIGEVFKNRYQIITKLGYGSFSTVWLAWDQRAGQHVTIKICTNDGGGDRTLTAMSEVVMQWRLAKFAEHDNHEGIKHIRLSKDEFQTPGTSLWYRHQCIVHQPQGTSFGVLQEKYPDEILPVEIVKSMITPLLRALDWLHNTCGVVHTDISPANILTTIENDAVFIHIEKLEAHSPSVPIKTPHADDPVYISRIDDMEGRTDLPILTCSSQMRVGGDRQNMHWNMPRVQRAPEVILGLPWGYAVDIWALGLTILELLEGRKVFYPVNGYREYDTERALAQCIGLLGPPPLWMLQQSPIPLDCFDEEGYWISELEIPEPPLEEFVTAFPPGLEKDIFLAFIRKMLTWDPNEREKAEELTWDEWVNVVGTPGIAGVPEADTQ